jgi:hypothetical protein
VLLGAAIPMFAAKSLRLHVVALLVLTLLPFTGVITIGEALAGTDGCLACYISAIALSGQRMSQQCDGQFLSLLSDARSVRYGPDRCQLSDFLALHGLAEV